VVSILSCLSPARVLPIFEFEATIGNSHATSHYSRFEGKTLLFIAQVYSGLGMNGSTNGVSVPPAGGFSIYSRSKTFEQGHFLAILVLV